MPKVSQFKTTLFKFAEEVSPILSIGDMEKMFPDTPYDNYKSTLQRMQKQGEVIQVWKGFYIIKPKEYFGDNIVPLREYIDMIMRTMKRDYYISLRGAMAEYVSSS